MSLWRMVRTAAHHAWIAMQESAVIRIGDLDALQAIHRTEHDHGHLMNVTTLHQPPATPAATGTSGQPHAMTAAECLPLSAMGHESMRQDMARDHS